MPFGQGFKDLSPPTKELMKLALEGKLTHDGHPVLRWMLDNIFIRQYPAGNIKPDKAKSTKKVDGAVALIMASTAPSDTAQGRSVKVYITKEDCYYCDVVDVRTD